MLLMTDIVAAFVFSAQTNKTKQNKKKKPNGTGALKDDSGLPGQRPHPKYCPNHFDFVFHVNVRYGLICFSPF